jgi:hypothetical protein
MAYSRHIFYFDNSGGVNVTFTFGPFTVNDIIKIYRVRLSGKLLTPTIVSISTSTLINTNQNTYAVCGVVSGTGSLDPTTDKNDSRWFFNTFNSRADGRTIWAPDSNNAATFSQVSIEREWNGQLPFSGNIDFFVSVGAPNGGSTAQNGIGQLEILSAN